MKRFIESISCNHTKEIIIACQETWLYNFPRLFIREFAKKYCFVHESEMDPKLPRNRGRPFGGIGFIISKSIAYKVAYTNSRCLSILLTDSNTLISNIYLPAHDSRITQSQNVEEMSEALGHLDAVHELNQNVYQYIVTGDFNVCPTDSNTRAEAVQQLLNQHNYKHTDLDFLSSSDFTHKSGRLIDRMVTSDNLTQHVQNVRVCYEYMNSDHNALITTITLAQQQTHGETHEIKALSWANATPAALLSYSRLCEKLCSKSLREYKEDHTDGPKLYDDLVSNIEKAATTCIPKSRKVPHKKHNIPMWRERMENVKSDVEYWTQVQFTQGGPTRCHPFIRSQLRLAKSRYRRQHRSLKREIEINIAETVTKKNCFHKLFPKYKAPTPPSIDGHSIPEQPAMWRQHFKQVFLAKEDPFNSDALLEDLNIRTSTADIHDFKHITVDDINNTIANINSNKSYKRHKHWENLLQTNHSAKLCLLEVLKSWCSDVILNENTNRNWTIFITDLSPIPKKGFPQLKTGALFLLAAQKIGYSKKYYKNAFLLTYQQTIANSDTNQNTLATMPLKLYV